MPCDSNAYLIVYVILLLLLLSITTLWADISILVIFDVIVDLCNVKQRIELKIIFTGIDFLKSADIADYSFICMLNCNRYNGGF